LLGRCLAGELFAILTLDTAKSGSVRSLLDGMIDDSIDTFGRQRDIELSRRKNRQPG
jgi:hypothetical protein